MTAGQDQGGGTTGEATSGVDVSLFAAELVKAVEEGRADALGELIERIAQREVQHPAKPPVGEVYESIAAVMDEVEHIGKDSSATGLPYKFRGIEAVLSKLGPRFRKHRLALSSTITWQEFETVGKMTDARVVVVFRVTSTRDGSFVEATALGEGRDSSDKAANKAMTQAQKYALCQLFMIPTGDPDPEAERPEYDTRRPAGPGQQFANPDQALQAIRGAASLSALDGIAQTLASQGLTDYVHEGHPMSRHLDTARGMLGGGR